MDAKIFFLSQSSAGIIVPSVIARLKMHAANLRCRFNIRYIHKLIPRRLRRIRKPETNVGSTRLRSSIKIARRLIKFHADIKIFGAEMHLIIIRKAFLCGRGANLPLTDVHAVNRDPVFIPAALVELTVDGRPGIGIVSIGIPGSRAAGG
ncbi:MAG: hypothetical protein ACI3ZE_08675, partial [Candidatus Woodwardiibium sp.]